MQDERHRLTTNEINIIVQMFRVVKYPQYFEIRNGLKAIYYFSRTQTGCSNRVRLSEYRIAACLFAIASNRPDLSHLHLTVGDNIIYISGIHLLSRGPGSILEHANNVALIGARRGVN